MKLYITTLAVLYAFSLSAQTNAGESFAILKGHIANNTDTTMDYFNEGYVSNGWHSFRIDRNGNFLEKIKVEAETNELGLHLGDGYDFSIQKNDTLELNWDARDVPGTLAIKSPAAWREKELRTQLSLWKKYFPLFNEMTGSLSKGGLSDSAVYARINGLYNQEIRDLLTDSIITRNTEGMAMNIYYQFAGQLWWHHLIPKYDLKFLQPVPNIEKLPFFQVYSFSNRLYELESEEAFKNCKYYRDFLFNYIRFYKPLLSWSAMGNAEETKNKTLPFSPAWDDYYAGLRSFHIKEIRDWFITQCIIDAFNFYSFEDASAVYRDFMSKDPSPLFVKRLKDVYTDMQHLRPGSPAPIFVLKNEQGQDVSLASFRGKAVFIDFWGVHCPPCIYDIKNRAPALHEKYKDKDIVFINICTDVPEKEWKENLASLHLTGINLIAGLSIKDPVCKAYNINGIPHYYLINQEGRIVNNNSSSPSQETALYNELDKLLK